MNETAQWLMAYKNLGMVLFNADFIILESDSIATRILKNTEVPAAGKKLIETYGVKVDPDIHKDVLARYEKLGVKPYSGFIQPKLVPVMKGDEIADVKVEYPEDFMAQMLEFSDKYSVLPTYN